MERAAAGTRPTRILVVATEELLGDELARLLAEHAGGRQGEVRVVAPAVTDSPLKHAFGDVDEAIAEAEERLRHSLEALGHSGLKVAGTIGDADPVIAIEDALAEFDAGEILIVTHPEDDGAWLEGDAFERAQQQFRLPVTHVTLERRGDADAGVVDIESADATDGGGDAEVELRGGNIPSLSWRDLGGILVAIVGSIILVVLAADCADASDAGCVVRYLLAGAVSLVNIAHVVGLLLFESVGYRGIFERFFAKLSLYGTPAAIVVSLIAG
jgi:hypothetical protein